MCIRDRAYDAVLDVVQFHHDVLYFFMKPPPVSYTHLIYSFMDICERICREMHTYVSDRDLYAF